LLTPYLQHKAARSSGHAGSRNSPKLLHDAERSGTSLIARATSLPVINKTPAMAATSRDFRWPQLPRQGVAGDALT